MLTEVGDPAVVELIEAYLALAEGDRAAAAGRFAAAAEALTGQHDGRDVVEALVGLAAVSREKDIRLVYFGVGATPVRARKAEAALAKGSVDDAVKALDLEPTSDVHATGEVKKHLAGVLLRRVAAQLMEPRA